MAKNDWEIPRNLQPNPTDYAYDLEGALRAVVGLRANVPSDAFTANTLGTERTGNGVVIRADGLVLTIGYLITEAETVWLITHDGRAVQGHALAFDQISGFGLVQALGRLDVPVMELGDSDSVEIGTDAVLAAGGGREHAIETRVLGRQEFAGYWEYLLDNAIFTAPAHPFWSGSALIGRDGKLLGIGSLILQQGDGKRRTDMNMVVPIAYLRPVLDDLLAHGRLSRPARPWLGLYALENEGGVVVGGVSERGPAAKAGIQQGDRILGVGDEEVGDLAGLWRKLWASGPAGAPVLLRVSRDGSDMAVRITSTDRTSLFRAPRLH
jgi:S1-C subfamily serine protease